MNLMPKAILWFRAYVVLLVLFYLSLVAVGILFLFLSPESLEMTAGQSTLVGFVLILLGLPFSLFVLPALSLPKRGGAWVYGLSIIILGITSIVLLPFGLPLLFCWLKDPVKDWFVPIDP